MRAARTAVSNVVAAVIVIAIVAVAGAAYFGLSSLSGTSTSSLTTTTASPTNPTSSRSTTTASSTTASSTTSSSSATTSTTSTTTTASASLTTGTGILIETFAPPIPVFAPNLPLNYTMSILTFGGTPSTLSLSVTGPAGISFAVAPTLISPTVSTSSMVQVLGKVSASMANGTYPVTVTATGSGQIYTETLSVKVVKYLVVMPGASFVPLSLTVPLGATVTWLRLNGELGTFDDGTHDINFQSPSLPVSPGIPQYDTFSYTFTKAGSYPYVCDYHPGMAGTITVTP